MKGLRRLFSNVYPYHSKKEIQRLNEFPFQLYTKEMASPESTTKIKIDSIEEGMKQVFQIVMTAIAEDQLDDLEDLLEHNLLQKLKTYFASFKESGYKIILNGSIEGTEIAHFYTSYYSGAVLPYRNLNFSSENYASSQLSQL